MNKNNRRVVVPSDDVINGQHRDKIEKRVQFRSGDVIHRTEDNKKILEGYASVFYDPNDPGTEYQLWPGVVERIMPGAFNKSLTEGKDVVGLFNHNFDHLLGRTASGTLRLRVDAKGLYYTIDVGETTISQDVWQMAMRKDITGSSFGFYPVETKFIDLEDGGLIIERHVADLVDVSPVTNPAYASSEVSARSRSATERELHRNNWFAKSDDAKRANRQRERLLLLQQQQMAMNNPT